MVLRAAILLLVLVAPAAAASRTTNIAMAVALLDVAEHHCTNAIAVDAAVKANLLLQFHEYDIGGLASSISGPFNAFYEDFALQAKTGRDQFCHHAPDYAASTGYPVIKPAR